MRYYSGFVVQCDTEDGATEVECDFYYDPPNHYNDNVDIEIVSLKVDGKDVSKVISSYQWDNIESQLLEIMLSSY